MKLNPHNIRCPACKEVPWQWRWTEGGKECSLCRHVRPTTRRTSKKKQRLEATLQEVLRSRNP